MVKSRRSKFAAGAAASSNNNNNVVIASNTATVVERQEKKRQVAESTLLNNHANAAKALALGNGKSSVASKMTRRANGLQSSNASPSLVSLK